MKTPVALSIAGSDPSGGAGIQADLKTFHRFGVYGEAVITLITVQNTRGVRAVHLLDATLVREQLHAVLEDIPPHAVKTGALGSREIVEMIASTELPCPLIVDPVMTSTSGASLGHAIDALLPRAFLLTPNLDEASMLAGFPVTDVDSMRRAAEKIASLGVKNVLIKGGHLQGDAIDLLYNGTFHKFSSPRIATPHTHGTGCTYSAAITAEIAKGTELIEAIRRAKTFLCEAIRSNPGLGRGSGPLNHFAG
ncbi:MAG: bifunctional hydroxymethylpyrimidine kinase/phosphomethylpyrimidine kinase [Acidobacteriia bacterium]|nr:bifunctional hydroxymethylpyrimidine kinase/phosphomethylpyrimidine kinase [Terriglobia bacterium]